MPGRLVTAVEGDALRPNLAGSVLMLAFPLADIHTTKPHDLGRLEVDPETAAFLPPAVTRAVPGFVFAPRTWREQVLLPGPTGGDTDFPGQGRCV